MEISLYLIVSILNTTNSYRPSAEQKCKITGLVVTSIPGADPGFPVVGGANPPGVPTYDFAKFCEKLHEIKKILGRRGGGGPKSATAYTAQQLVSKFVNDKATTF